WVLDLQFDKLNLENLLPLQPVNATDEGATQVGQSQATQSRPVISSNLDLKRFSMRKIEFSFFSCLFIDN
ncbi:hypothetical protein, partial [Enterobacter sp. BH2-YP2023]|uniref:hypothetical protein n=1 Tax=Enterobacter sp. BH2-YP2023 TaxID=3402818 RepID=UPI003D7450A0